MRRFLEDQELIGRVMSGASWLSWRALLIAMMGERLTDEERAIFTRLTGRASEPLERVEEFWAVTGRRGGKSFAMAVLIVYLAVFVNYRGLTIGETGVVLCLAKDQRQARVVFDYIAGLFEGVPLLMGLVRQKVAETLSLVSGIDIEIRSASFRGLRGVTCVAVVCDEVCFWFTNEDAANSDVEILGAVRPALGTTNGPLICISTPYARRGAAYEAWAKEYGPKGDPLILVARGGTRDLNPSYPQKKIDREMAKDPAFARAEYYGEWRDDVAAFIGRELVESLIERGVTCRLPDRRKYGYVGFADPAGGSGADTDSFTAGIAHREFGERGPHYKLDWLFEKKPPFSPDAVIREVCGTLKAYGVRKVVGDKWADGFVPEAFRRYGVVYEASARPKSDLYLQALAMMTSRQCSLLDDKRLVSQLIGLERRTSRSGKDIVDHVRDAHDDVANACCGALTLAMAKQPMRISQALLDRLEDPYRAGLPASMSDPGREARFRALLRDVASW